MGKLDLWVTDSKYNRLMHNTGQMRFDDISTTAGLSQAEAQYTSWATGAYDFDNDGWLDILAFHGGLIHMVPQEHSLFRNLGQGKFEDVSRTGGSVLDVKTVARGGCFADYDNDGKVDAFMVNLDTPGTLLHNATANKQHWISLNLRGTKSNRDGIGAHLELTAAGKNADSGTSRGLGLSLAGRWPDALWTRLGRDSGQTYNSVAQRQAAGAHASGGRSHTHRRGTGVRAKLTQLLAIAAATVLLMVAYCARMQVRAAGPIVATEPQYLSPSEMAFSPDGHWLYVVCERSDQLLVLDSATGVVKNRIPVGHIPRGLAVSPDGARVYVANSWDDTLSVIDVKDPSRTEEFATGWEPISVVVDRAGKTLYVANRVSNDISLIETATGHEIKRLSAGRGASYLALSPDGTRIYCTHVYPRIAESRTPPESEITVIDTARQIVVNRLPLKNVAGMFHVALSADGRFGVAAQMRPKNLVPLAHVEHGFVFGYSLTLFGLAVGAPVQVPLGRAGPLLLAAVWSCDLTGRQSHLCRVGRVGCCHRNGYKQAAELFAAASGALRQRPVGRESLRERAHRGGTQPPRPAAFARRQTPLCRQSHGRHAGCDRHGHQQSGGDPSTSAARTNSPLCATGNNSSTARGLPSRGNSVARTVTSTTPLTA